LDQGRSQRTIRRLTGLSRGSIAEIASGRWREREAARAAHRARAREEGQTMRIARCPACGARAEIIPAAGVCRACHVLALCMPRKFAGRDPDPNCLDFLDSPGEPPVGRPGFPTLAEIRQRRDAIRDGWSAEERAARWREARRLQGQIDRPEPYALREIRCSELALETNP
jgi:hypothetical protein